MSDELKHHLLNFTLSRLDAERAVVLADDLSFLRSLPNERLLTHTEIRLAASVLRRVLIDGELDRMWRAMGANKVGPPTVLATDLDAVIKGWPDGWLIQGWAGGANSGAASHRGYVLGHVPAAVHQVYPSPDAYFTENLNTLPHELQIVRFKVRDWLQSTSVALRTVERGLFRISRRSVLQFIANRKGGVHFDPAKKPLASVKRSQWSEEMAMHLLGEPPLRVGHLSGVEFEIMSMVQAVAQAEWAEMIVNVAQQAMPQDFRGDPNVVRIFTGVVTDADPDGWTTMHYKVPASSESSAAR